MPTPDWHDERGQTQWPVEELREAPPKAWRLFGGALFLRLLDRREKASSRLSFQRSD
jgi:hypothetical protein